MCFTALSSSSNVPLLVYGETVFLFILVALEVWNQAKFSMDFKASGLNLACAAFVDSISVCFSTPTLSEIIRAGGTRILEKTRDRLIHQRGSAGQLGSTSNGVGSVYWAHEIVLSTGYPSTNSIITRFEWSKRLACAYVKASFICITLYQCLHTYILAEQVHDGDLNMRAQGILL